MTIAAIWLYAEALLPFPKSFPLPLSLIRFYDTKEFFSALAYACFMQLE
jgi:hypothetical protein